MIRFALSCDRDHGFDSWFKGDEAFSALKAAGQVACPVCGATAVEKELMTPAVSRASAAA